MTQTLNILKALADRNRLRIVLALEEHGEMCACQITELLQVAGATASRHLSLLVNAEFVKARKEGRWIFYRLTPEVHTEHRDLFNWLRQQVQTSPDFEADRRTLASIMARDPEELCRRQRGERCCPSNKKENINA